MYAARTSVTYGMIKYTAMSLFVNPFGAFAILLALWGLWRLTRWFASGGRMPLRGRRGTASGFSGAALAMDAFYRPGAKQVIEAQLREETSRDDDDEGDPPDSGDARGVDSRED